MTIMGRSTLCVLTIDKLGKKIENVKLLALFKERLEIRFVDGIFREFEVKELFKSSYNNNYPIYTAPNCGR